MVNGGQSVNGHGSWWLVVRGADLCGWWCVEVCGVGVAPARDELKIPIF